jgi:hypothetical protein
MSVQTLGHGKGSVHSTTTRRSADRPSVAGPKRPSTKLSVLSGVLDRGDFLRLPLFVLCPLLQVQDRLEQQELGLGKRGLLGDGSEPLGLPAIQSCLSGMRRAHGS